MAHRKRASSIRSPGRSVGSAKQKTKQESRKLTRSLLHLPSRIHEYITSFPSSVRYVAAVLGSLVLSAAMYSGTSSITVGDLATVCRDSQNGWEAGALIAWRAVLLGISWVLGFDGQDIAEFALLTHFPIYSLLATFYQIRPTTVLLALSIDIAALTLPFVLLRGLNSVHTLRSPRSKTVSNRMILKDPLIAIYTSAAATALYSVALYLSYATWLPVHLVTYFDEIPDISAVHTGPAALPGLFLKFIFNGYAIYDLLFVSSIGYAEDEKETVDPVHGEYLITSLYKRTWGRLSRKWKILIIRTIALALTTLLNTVIQLTSSIRGVSIEGSAGWGALWAVTACLIGVLFAWIEAAPKA